MRQHISSMFNRITNIRPVVQEDFGVNPLDFLEMTEQEETDIDFGKILLSPDLLEERVKIHGTIDRRLKNYASSEITRLGNHDLIETFLTESYGIAECKVFITQYANDNSHIINVNGIDITVSKTEYDRIGYSGSDEHVLFLNSFIENTDLTYQELSLLLDIGRAEKFILDKLPYYLSNAISTKIHKLFKCLPIEVIMDRLQNYFIECDIDKTIKILTKDMLRVLKSHPSKIFSNPESNSRMVHKVLHAFKNLESTVDIFSFDIFQYTCIFSVLFMKQSDSFKMSWLDFFFIENITAYDIRKDEIPNFASIVMDTIFYETEDPNEDRRVRVSGRGISCQKGIIERFSLSFAETIAPFFPIEEEQYNLFTELQKENKNDVSKIFIDEFKQRLTIWTQDFINTTEIYDFTKDQLTDEWGKYYKNKITEEYLRERDINYDMVKNGYLVQTGLKAGLYILSLFGDFNDIEPVGYGKRKIKGKTKKRRANTKRRGKNNTRQRYTRRK